METKASSFGLRPTQLADDLTPSGKSNEKESVKPANRYSYPQLAFKLPALAPGQNSIGTGGQYSIGADTLVQENKELVQNATNIEIQDLRAAHERRDKNEFERLSDTHLSLYANLERLTGELELTARLFSDAAETIKNLSQT